MKTLIFLVTILILLSAPAFAQTPTEKYGAFGLAYFNSGTPNIQGWAALGIPISEKTISYTDYDIAPIKSGGQASVAGVRLQYAIRTGLAYRIYNVTNSWSLWGLGNIGLAADGRAITRSFQYGGFLDKSIGKGWGVMLILSGEDSGATGRDFAPRIGIRKKL